MIYSCKVECNPFPLTWAPLSSSYVPSCSPMMIICVADPPKMVEFWILMKLGFTDGRFHGSSLLFRTPAGQFPYFGAVNFPLRPTSPKLRCRARTLRFAAAKIRVQKKSLLDIRKPFRKQSIASRTFFFIFSLLLLCFALGAIQWPLCTGVQPPAGRLWPWGFENIFRLHI